MPPLLFATSSTQRHTHTTSLELYSHTYSDVLPLDDRPVLLCWCKGNDDQQVRTHVRVRTALAKALVSPVPSANREPERGGGGGSSVLEAGQSQRRRASLATGAATAAAAAAKTVLLNDPSTTIRGVPYALASSWLRTAISRYSNTGLRFLQRRAGNLEKLVFNVHSQMIGGGEEGAGGL